MEQLNRNLRQDEDVGLPNNKGSDIRRPKNPYIDSAGAPQRLKRDIGFASIVRNKSAPPGLEKKLRKENRRPTEVYQDMIRLEVFKSEYEVFKNSLLEASSLSRVDSRDFSTMMTVKEYSSKLTQSNELYKYR